MTSKGREPVFFFFDVEAANSSVGADIIQFGVTCDPSVHLMAEFSALVKTKQKLSSFSKFFFNRANGGGTCVSSYIRGYIKINSKFTSKLIQNSHRTF